MQKPKDTIKPGGGARFRYCRVTAPDVHAKNLTILLTITKIETVVYIEPKLPVQTRYHVRTANGMHGVLLDGMFGLELANFSKNPQRLPMGLKIAYTKRNPLAILTAPEEVSTKLEAVLNLPFTTKTANDSTNNDSTDTNGLDELTKPTDWRDTTDLGYKDNNEMRTKILTMLTKHEDSYAGSWERPTYIVAS